MAEHWEAAPRHMMRLDIRSLLQDAAIEEVSVPLPQCSAEKQRLHLLDFENLKLPEKLHEYIYIYLIILTNSVVNIFSHFSL